MVNIKTIFVPKENLEKIITTEIKSAKEIKIAVFFAKKQMYNKLKSKLRRKRAQFVIGCDFYNTEPTVLNDIFEEIKAGASWACKLYNFPISGRKTFHMKVYIFKRGENVTVIIGSSNISEGGFLENFEYNVLMRGKESEPEIKEILANFEEIFDNGVMLNDDVVKQYKKEYTPIKMVKEIVRKRLKKLANEEPYVKSKKEILIRQYLDENKEEYSNWISKRECEWREKFYVSKRKLINKIKRNATLGKKELTELFGGKYPLFDLDNIIRTEGGYARRKPHIFVENEIINKNGVKK